MADAKPNGIMAQIEHFSRKTFMLLFHGMLKDLANETGLQVHRQRVLRDSHAGLRGPQRGTLWVTPRYTDGTCELCPRGQGWAKSIEDFLRAQLGEPSDFSKDACESPRWRTNNWEIVRGAARIMAQIQSPKNQEALS